jgi:hypothetical protein
MCADLIAEFSDIDLKDFNIGRTQLFMAMI